MKRDWGFEGGGGLMRALVGLVFLVLLVAPAGAQPACAPTPPDMLGPFYKPNAPERAGTGRGLVISGTVRSAADCATLPGARVEWWSVNARGQYDDEHRATQRADAEGRYRYETDFPRAYFGRPPHVHVRVTAPGHRALVTQVYPKPGETSIAFDLVLVRE
jgi:protocatechuate 3,4-dioxygenase beta subunit